MKRALLAAVLLLAATPGAGQAQVFLASRPHPEFAVGPLFVVANVSPDLSVSVNLSFSLTLRPRARPERVAQDLFILWPAEVTKATASGPADPSLAPEVEGRGFVVLTQGRLALRSRDRTLIGTPTLGDVLPQAASYVTYSRRGPIASQIIPVTYIKIPWTPKLADPLTVMTLVLPLRGLVTPKASSWAADTFWGRRSVLTVGFGDLGPPVLGLYPLYFEHRDRVVRLAREYSLIAANFADAGHLLIDEVEPAAATRRPSRIRAGTEIVSLVLAPSEGVGPQAVKVEFSYFTGLIAWRPILVSLGLLVLGNVAGLIMFGREIFQMARSRRRARVARARGRGPWLTEDGPAGLANGATTYEEVLSQWGPPDEERDRVKPPGRRTLVYRGWQDGRAYEVEIALENGRVSGVERRVQRLPP